ncbi:hypothetical protein ACF8PD_01300 [Vibrio plantisponsor]|uniref:hypothetical protein n=1 Tax=Vibrio plantisponsor TaxID=664643 RepID=UPI00370B3187
MKAIKYTISALLVILLVGCGTTPINYQVQPLSATESYNIIDELIMTQHRNWRPDYFVVTDTFLGWGYGVQSSGKTSAIGSNNSAFVSSRSTTRNVSDRVYFSRIGQVQLYSWKRKFKQWYVVSLLDGNGNKIKNILYTRSLSDAEKMVDAMTVVLSEKTVVDKSVPAPPQQIGTII